MRVTRARILSAVFEIEEADGVLARQRFWG
jgi:hypothetical protein